MHIERRQQDAAKKNAIFHKIADLPGGVTVETTGLTAEIIPEATLLTPGTGGKWKTIAEAVVLEVASASATDYVVKKGHLFKVEDKILKSGSTTVNITAINTTDANKDTITVDATLGAKAVGDSLVEGGKGNAVGITGEDVVIKTGANAWVSCWVNAVINSAIKPEPANKPTGVIYVKS